MADLLDLVNQARIAEGVSALAPSTVLTSVAQVHSNDMAKTQNLSHIGSDGSEFWQRMQTGGYNLTTGAENILFRYDTEAKGTFEQWQGSPSHLANMINPAYHEIGIAYTQSDNGTYYYTMILGARADSTPQPYASPTMTATATASMTLRPTLTPIIPSMMPTTTVVQPTAIQLTPMGQAVSAQVPTATSTPRVSINTAPSQLMMTYDDSTMILQNIAQEPINVNSIIFAGPGGTFASSRWRDVGASGLNSLQPGDCLQIWTTQIDTFLEKPDTCAVRQAWVTTGPPGQFWRGEGTFTVQKNNRIVAECTIAAGTCGFNFRGANDPVLLLTKAYNDTDVRLFVDSDGVTIMNISGVDIDLSTMILVGETGTFDPADWNNRQVERPFEHFPTGVCMQVWAFEGEEEEPTKPAECEYRFAWLLLPPEEQFWLEDSFTVMNMGIDVATCSTSERICNVILPPEQQ